MLFPVEWLYQENEMKKEIKRLEYLNKMLVKYANRWNFNGGESSNRMYDWVDEYNAAKKNHPEAWKEYCQKFGADEKHTAYDVLS
jgi:hypothetical protein